MGASLCSLPNPNDKTVSTQELSAMLKNEDYVEGDAPLIHVTIREVAFQGGETENIAVSSFSISGLTLEGQIAIKGNREQILQVLGPEIAIKLIDRVSISPKRRKSVSEMDGLPDHHRDEAGNRTKLPGMEQLSRERPKSSDNLLHGSGSWDGDKERKMLSVTAVVAIRKDNEKSKIQTKLSGFTAEVRAQHLDLMHCTTIRQALERGVSSLLEQGLSAGTT
mmetsp:Transcript_50152/g.92605  ORF Transcript_50152/g.92605 Transcript_50152/m.92605 type:complete len:222 (+) Transcript_50152:154-819(+)